jgi:outer membrane protein assembly factor BamB
MQLTLSALLVAALLLPALARAVAPLGQADRLPSGAFPLGRAGDGSNRFVGATPLLAWDLSTDTQVRWRVALPTAPTVTMLDSKSKTYGRVLFGGTAQPLAFGDRVVTTAGRLGVVCLNAKDGTVRWRVDIDPTASIMPDAVRAAMAPAWKAYVADCDGPADTAPKPADYAAALAGCGLSVMPGWRHSSWMPWTPATDGRRIFATSTMGLVTALDMDGKLLWQRVGVGFARAPLLVDGRLIVCAEAGKLDQTIAPWGGGFFVLALDPATGDLLWKAPWKAGSWHGPGNPVAATLGARSAIVVADGQVLDPADGKLLADLGAVCGLGASPGVSGSRVAISHGDYHAPPPSLLVADLLDKPNEGVAPPSDDVPVAAQGTMPASTHTVLKLELRKYEIRGEHTAPLLWDNLVVFSTLRAAYWADLTQKSPQLKGLVAEPKVGMSARGIVLAGHHLFIWDDKGGCHVIALVDGAPKEVSVNPGPLPVAPPAFLGDAMFVRTADALVCVGKP